MIVDMMAASDNEEHRECAQLDNAVEVVAGLAWQYFKKDWDRVSLAAWLAAILLRMAVWPDARVPAVGNVLGDGCSPMADVHAWDSPRGRSAPHPNRTLVASTPTISHHLQVSTRGWNDHPEFQRRCIVKIQGLIQKKKVASVPRKVRWALCLAGCGDAWCHV
jgi:hypothetical protein